MIYKSTLNTKLLSMKKNLLILMLTAFIGCDFGKPTEAKLRAEREKITLDSLAIDSANVAVGEAKAALANAETAKESESTNWQYSEEEDKMTSKKTFFANILSPTKLNFDFPYEGSSASIILRKKRGELNVILQVSKGQFKGYVNDGQTIKARFDKGVVQSYSCSEASDNSSNVLFINSANKFLKNLKNYHKLVIEAEFYQEGVQQIEFDISNLKWNH
jgi:hypothetical protein